MVYKKKLNVPASSAFQSHLSRIVNKVELIQKLRTLDEVTLLEALEISSDDIVDAFLDKINEKLDYLYKQVKDQDWT